MNIGALLLPLVGLVGPLGLGSVLNSVGVEGISSGPEEGLDDILGDYIG